MNTLFIYNFGFLLDILQAKIRNQRVCHYLNV